MIEIILVLLFLALSAFFSSSETAFFSLSKVYRKKLENSSSATQKQIAKLLKKPKELLTVILLGNMVVNVAIASLSAVVAIKIAPKYSISESIALTIEIALVTAVILLFGEILPKVYALQSAEKYAQKIVYPITFFKIILFPIVKILEMISNFFSPQKTTPESSKITSEDIKHIFNEKDDTDIPKIERDMINNAFEFSDTKVREIMTPRVDVIAKNANDKMTDLIETIQKSGFSRIPIFVGNIDNIIGMVYSKDIILNRTENKNIKNLMRNCYFIPENMKISYLLNYFQKNKIHQAIVVDEYGGTSGLVTLEDILEEIVGEILDETDVDKIDIKKVGENEYLIDGYAEIDELNEKFGLEIDDCFDSFSGFLYQIFNKIPEQNDEIIYKEKFKFQIVKLEGQKINSVELRILESNLET
ncbi:MAG: HlyC/CorC family transporter [Candidatus Cloacimonetes bacterium]|nr:HlyC/CorC family transporter [Candidatus Cloacimonadota bacterium]